MAIQIIHNTKYGDNYTSAYARVIALTIDYERELAQVSIAIYKSEIDREQGKLPVDVETFTYEGDSFGDFFREVSAEKINAGMNPLADVYNDLTSKESTKYFEGEKLFDELPYKGPEEEFEGEMVEVGKKEKINM